MREILTLENVQVDCRGLSYDQIDEMLSVVDDKLDPLNSSFDVDTECLYLSFNKYCRLFGFYGFDEEQHLITYEKFMELFTGQVADVGGMIVEKPKHYPKYTDTFARMEANCTIEECLAFAKASIDSYNWNTKEQSKEDFEKIISYANWVVRLILLYVSKDEIRKWLEEEGNKLKLK